VTIGGYSLRLACHQRLKRRFSMKLNKVILTALLSAFLLTGLSACEKGPAEKAGEAIDDAASNVADSAEDAADTVKEKME
jgi:hypothetical protein